MLGWRVEVALERKFLSQVARSKLWRWRIASRGRMQGLPPAGLVLGSPHTFQPTKLSVYVRVAACLQNFVGPPFLWQMNTLNTNSLSVKMAF